MVQELKMALDIIEPDTPSRRQRDDQVKATIVVHVRHQQARGGNSNATGKIGPPGKLLHTPRCAIRRMRQALYGPINLKYHEIQHAIAVYIGYRYRQDFPQLLWQVVRLELPGTLVGIHVQRTGRVQQDGIRHAVSIHIPPGEGAQPGDPVKQAQLCEGAIPVVSEDERLTLWSAKHQVEVAFQIDVRGPHTSVGSVRHRSGKRHMGSHVSKDTGIVLPQQPQTTRTGKRQIYLEITIK